MKNLLLGSIVLTLFAASFALVQVSCSKSNAQTTTNNPTPIGKIVFIKWNPTDNNSARIWTANYDGTNAAEGPITLPGGASISVSYDRGVRLSPDGQKIFFNVTQEPDYISTIYSCNIDGSNLFKVSEAQAGEYHILDGAYSYD